MTSGLVVLHEDPELLAVCKPAGTLVIPGRGVPGKTLKEAAEEHCGASVWVVHRLDREASGVVVFAKTAAEHRRLCGLFERRGVEKVYWALVRGRLEGEGEVALPLKAFGSGRIGTSEGGLSSLTRYRSLEVFSDAALLEVRPLTGRRHQIRVHLHSLGFPILGDPLYGRPLPVPGAPRLMLHALELRFPAPDGTPVRLRAEPPPDFAAVLEGLRISPA